MIGFAGLSHLGIVSSVAAAANGYEVVAFDNDSVLCEKLKYGLPPIWEPQLSELLKDNRSRLRFSSHPDDLKECDLIYFSLDVPTDRDGHADLSSLNRMIEQIAAHVSMGTTLVVLSQVPPGFTRKLSGRLEQDYPNLEFMLFYQVETLIFGAAVERALHPERFIVGCSQPCDLLPTMYEDFLASFGCPVLPMRYESAELAKAAINMYLASSVCVTNTLAELCEVLGADWQEIIPTLRLDKRIGPHAYLVPGLGLSGGNLTRDMATISTLANELGTDAGVVDAWISNSRHRRDWVLRTIHNQAFSGNSDPAIAIWGLAYKAGTKSTKDSPALALLDSLRPFSVSVYDPQAVLDPESPANIVQCKTALESCKGADVLAIMTPWPEFSSIDLNQVRKQMVGRVIIDPFGVMDWENCAHQGFSYFRMGAPATVLERTL